MKQFKLQELADRVSGRLKGDPDRVIVDADIIRDAGSGFLTFAQTPDFFSRLESCDAAAVLIPGSQEDAFEEVCRANGFHIDFIAVENVLEAFETIVKLFRPPLPSPACSISSSAHLDPTAVIGNDVFIGPGAVIGPRVRIGDRCRIHSGVHVMAATEIGPETEIFSNAVIYEYSRIGQRCKLHANCVIGAHGFGYASSAEGHQLKAQLGNVMIGDDVDIGAGTTIDRASYGSTRIGSGTKIDNQVQIGHNCRIGKRNLICSLVGIAGSCVTGDDVVLAGQVGIGDHTEIGARTVLGAKAGVMADIPPDQVYVGIPATPAKQQMTIIAATHRLPEMRKQIKRLEKQIAGLVQTDAASGQPVTNHEIQEKAETNNDAA